MAGTEADNPDSIFIEHCNVSHVSGPAQQNTSAISIRGSSGDTDTSNYSHYCVVRACTITNIMDETGWAGHTKGICFYEAQNCVIESCYVEGEMGIGINIKGNSASRTCHGNVVRFNEVINCHDGINLTTWHVRDSVYGNIVRDGVGDSWGITLEGEEVGRSGDSACAILNNTIINVAKPIVLGPTTSFPGLDGTGNSRHIFKYNIISTSTSDDFIIWRADNTDTANIRFDSSIYYNNGNSISIRNHGTLANWQASGFDVHTRAVNPSFVPSNPHFARTDSLNIEMNVEYGGKRWTLFGAWQPGSTPECDPPEVPAQDAPVNGTTDLYLPFTFDWQDVDGAITYQLQIDNNSSFTSPEIDIFLPSSAYEVSGLVAGATYHWRVKAFNACGGGGWSSSRNFTTHCDLLTAPEVAQPVDGANNLTQPVYLNWSDVSGAVTYQLTRFRSITTLISAVPSGIMN